MIEQMSFLDPPPSDPPAALQKAPGGRSSRMSSEGMLWFDDRKDVTLWDKVRRAADYYREKYGEEPNLCEVPPGTASAAAIESVDGILVRESAYVIPGHFYIGRFLDEPR